MRNRIIDLSRRSAPSRGAPAAPTRHARHLTSLIAAILILIPIPRSPGIAGPGTASAQSAGPPSVTGVNQKVSYTAGGTVVDISGANLGRVTGVTFGGVAVHPPYFRVNSDTLVTAMSPPHSSGLVDITVMSAEGSATSTGFRYTDEGWADGPTMKTPRSGHTLTRLSGPECLLGALSPAYCGKVLAAGGITGDGSPLNTGELFDPRGNNGAGSWTPVGAMSQNRAGHAAAALPGGRVLVTGGDAGAAGKTADIFDPGTDTQPPSWTAAPSMGAARVLHTATSLDDGRVLVVGGNDLTKGLLASSEVFDPVLGRWTPGPPLVHGRFFHSAVLVKGRVLVAGGINKKGEWEGTSEQLTVSQGGAWIPAGPVPILGGRTLTVIDPPLCQAIVVPVPTYCGQVIMPGGILPPSPHPPDGADQTKHSAVFNGALGWTLGSETQPRGSFDTAPLPSGDVLMAGQISTLNSYLGASLYDNAAHRWRATYRPPKISPTPHPTATALTDGRVLVTGGDRAYYGPLDSTELFSQSMAPPVRTPAIGPKPLYGDASGSILTIEGIDLFPVTAVDVGGLPAIIRSNTDTTLMVATPPHAEGVVTITVTVAAGRSVKVPFTYHQGRWLPTLHPPISARNNHQAVLLDPPGCHDGSLKAPGYPCGKVLVAGGDGDIGDGGGEVGKGSAELYDPEKDTWIATGAMTMDRATITVDNQLNPLGRGVFTLTVLPDGRVLAEGGCCNSVGDVDDTYEVYEPRSGIWTTYHPPSPRFYHTATVLDDGRVFIAGGYDNEWSLSATRYSPNTAPSGYSYLEWQRAPHMRTHRYMHVASRLPDGKVMLAGGVGWAVADPDVCEVGFSQRCELPLKSVEIYDPAGPGSWSFGPDMNFGHIYHSATSLDRSECHDPSGARGYPCGQILVAGGDGTNAEVYDSAATPAHAWTVTGAMLEPSMNHAATLLPDGRVLLSGGVDPFPQHKDLVTHEQPTSAAAEIFDPMSKRWIRTGDMATVSGYYSSATLLDGPACRSGPPVPAYCGRVLTVGRDHDHNPASDLYTPVPSITKLEPGAGSSRGGTTVVIHGHGFTKDTMVTIAGVAPPAYSVDSTTQITAVTPPHAEGAVEVGVSSLGGSSTLTPFNPSAQYTFNSCVPSPTGGELSYPAGYSLIGPPAGTSIPAQSFLYGWFNQGGGSGYTAADPSATTAEAGHGYWAWFSCTRVVPRGPGQASVSSPLSAYHASMVGNPSGTSPAVVTGHDFAARWDPGLNGGAGGYTISGYREPQQLAVGEGMWVFAYGDTTVTTRAG